MKKILIQLTLDGKFVRAFMTITAAAEANGFKSLDANMHKFMERKITHANKFLWAYMETDNPEEIKRVERDGKVSPPLIWKAQALVQDAIVFHQLKNIEVFSLKKEQVEILADFISDFITELKD